MKWIGIACAVAVLGAPALATAQQRVTETGAGLAAPAADVHATRGEGPTPMPITDLPLTRYTEDSPSLAGPRSDAAVVIEVLGGSLGVLAGLTPLFAGVSPLVLPLSLGVGITVGVLAGGALAGGNGSFGSVFLGQATGGVATIPLVFLGVDTVVLLIAVIVLPLTGGVLGYEISNDVPRESSATARAFGPEGHAHAQRVLSRSDGLGLAVKW